MVRFGKVNLAAVLCAGLALIIVFRSFNSTAKSSTVTSPQDAVPRFETAPCAIAIPELEQGNVKCGYLVVRENRERPNGKVIRLPVIILKSNSSTPAPDPVVRTLGGPGGSSLRMVRGRRSSPWLNDRDEIIFEQRGTLFAQPKLDCPEVDAARSRSVRANLPERTAIRNEVDAARTCRDRLSSQGIDLSAYDSVQSAADIEDLRRVLGYQQWNLYGVSYSARLMLEVMRNHPQGVRSVVLESVLPLSVNYDEVGVDAAVRSLNTLFGECASDASCAKRYPRLEQVFYDLVRRANEKPIPFSVKEGGSNEAVTLKLNGHDITTWVLDYLLSAEAADIQAAPARIFQVAGGDLAPLKDYAEGKLGSGFYMLGMRYSVWCREEMPFEDRRKIAAQAFRYPRLRGYEMQPALMEVCKVWGTKPAALRENKPVTSKIPTLILAAQYDAYTPPAWGRMTARTLSHSYFYEVPGVGHGPGFHSRCATQMVAAFFDNPGTAPDDKCLKSMQPKFVPAR